MKAKILDLIRERIVLLDGGMGTELIKAGLPQGSCPELWNIENPEVVRAIYRSYYQAGSDAVLTNTFGGNQIKLSSFGLEKRCHELNFAAAQLANEVRPEGKFIGGSIGPTGKFLQPQGEFTEKEFEEAFAVQAKALTLGKVDFLMIETMYDLREALCAVRAAQRASSLPLIVSMTFNRLPRGFFTLMGNSIRQCLEELEGMEVAVAGSNCTLNSAEMADLIGEMKKFTSLPLVAKPNAGQPVLTKTGEVAYSQDIKDFLRHIPRIIENGASLVGGCCGTNPDYIRGMAEIIKKS